MGSTETHAPNPKRIYTPTSTHIASSTQALIMSGVLGTNCHGKGGVRLLKVSAVV